VKYDIKKKHFATPITATALHMNSLKNNSHVDSECRSCIHACSLHLGCV